MNLKKTAIALAVASVAATPILASADGSVYGSMRYGFEYKDDGGTTNTVSQFKDFGSRFGIKGETDLGNGLTAFGKWEQRMFSTGVGVRDFKLGLKGDWGTLYMGDGIDHAWDTVMSTDNTWWYGGQRKLTDGVQSNAITYQNSWGAIGLGATVQMNKQLVNANEETTDAYELVGTWGIGTPIHVAIGVTDAKAKPTDPEPIVGFVVGGEVGNSRCG